MEENKNASEMAANLSKTDCKGKHFCTQYQIVCQSFKERPKTMLEVSIETGILRANICRYVKCLRRDGQIQIIRKGYCPKTHYKAGFYSTDETLFTKSDVKQLTLFDYGI